MTCLMPCGRGCHSPIPPTLVPATSIPGLPKSQDQGEPCLKDQHPHLGIPGDLERVCGYLDYSCVDPYQPSLSPPTQLLQQLLHQFYPLETGN